MTSSIEDWLAEAKRPELPVQLCLRGDLVGRHRELEQRLQTASRVTPSIGQRSEAALLAEEIQAVEAEIAAAKRTFWLRAMEPQAWSDFWAGKPERGKDEAEEVWKARWYAWVCQLVSNCAFDPVMTPDQVDRLVPNLSGAQWDELSDGAYNLNAKGVVVPFSLAASALTGNSEQS